MSFRNTETLSEKESATKSDRKSKANIARSTSVYIYVYIYIKNVTLFPYDG